MRGRLSDLKRFYKILDRLCEKSEGVRRLADCNGKMDWPQRGVYFFMEEGEIRTESGEGLRVVRIGTHALKAGSKSTLWGRLKQHKGQENGGGNHRGSIFRLIVGTSLIKRGEGNCASWDNGKGAASRDIRTGEQEMEKKVSDVIGNMPFLHLAIGDAPGPESDRGYIERNAIALLSNWEKSLLDPPSERWLGRDCQRERVRMSGLWNQNHVEESYEPQFLNRMETLVEVHQ